jgi:hypothetical protein
MAAFATVVFHDVGDDGLESGIALPVADTVWKGNVDGVVFSSAQMNVTPPADWREVLSIWLEAELHDYVGGVNGLLNSVAVDKLKVHVKRALLDAKERHASNDNI